MEEVGKNGGKIRGGSIHLSPLVHKYLLLLCYYQLLVYIEMLSARQLWSLDRKTDSRL